MPQAALAQDKGTVNPKPLPPLANPNDPKIGAKELFGRKVLPAAMPTRVLGFYAHGCIAGAEGLPINGDNWQVMRLSRNRYWGHPDMVALVKRLAAKARKDAGWPGHTGRRHVAAARRADVYRPCQPSGGTGRRHLADADAEPAIVAQRARGDVGGHDGARRPARHRSERLDADASCGDPRRRAGADRAAHLRQCRDQEGAVPRSQGRSPLALTRCGRCTATTITSISASNARPAAANARPSPIRPRAKAAAPAISPTGSAMRCCIRSRPKVPPKPKPPMTMAALPPACKAVLAAPDAKQ